MIVEQRVLPQGGHLVAVRRTAPVCEVRALGALPSDVDPGSAALAHLVSTIALRHQPWDAWETTVTTDADTGSLVVSVTCLTEDLPRALSAIGEAVGDARYPGRPDVTALHRRVLHPSGSVVVCGSPCGTQEIATHLLAGLERLGPWDHAPDDEQAAWAVESTPPPAPPEGLALRAPAPPIDSPHWLGHHLSLGILGELGSGRLTTALRADGLAYGVSAYRTEEAGTPVTLVEPIGTTDAGPTTVAAMLRVLEEYSREGPTEAELGTAVRRAHGVAMLGTDALSTTVEAIAGFVRRGLPATWLQETAARMQATTRQEVAAAARAWFAPELFTSHHGPRRNDPS